jgi:arabinan endo-1,5-alpha-L-arabinosidase
MQLSLQSLVPAALLGAMMSSPSPTPAAPKKAPPQVLALEGDTSPIHDPAIVREGDTYYVFASNQYEGKLLPIFRSEDLRRWTFSGNVFDGVPEWALKDVPGAKGIWAPDISYYRGEFRLYYSVSTFGSNRSVIGLATNKTLDPKSPEYRWVDRGKVIESGPTVFWNAIDPNLTLDARGHPWLTWGSFWGGIMMRKLDPSTGKPFPTDTTVHPLATRPQSPHAVEAPFIVRKGGYFYLFLSFDFCCRGRESTYNIRVGRSRSITGPYRDQTGKPMSEGGGTLVLEGTSEWRGPGHPAVLLGKKEDVLVFHAYHGTTGRPHLMISTLAWEDGWPRAGALPGS